VVSSGDPAARGKPGARRRVVFSGGNAGQGGGRGPGRLGAGPRMRRASASGEAGGPERLPGRPVAPGLDADAETAGDAKNEGAWWV
jgi:hypothetical protein